MLLHVMIKLQFFSNTQCVILIYEQSMSEAVAPLNPSALLTIQARLSPEVVGSILAVDSGHLCEESPNTLPKVVGFLQRNPVSSNMER